MFTNIFAKIKSYLGSLLAAVVLLLVVLWGAGNGQKVTQAEAVYSASQQTQKALQYFYQDQDRYPSVLEFSDQNTMLNYLSIFPLLNIISKNCSQSFDYKKVTDSSYTLSFCLATAVSGYQAGWNSVSGVPVTAP